MESPGIILLAIFLLVAKIGKWQLCSEIQSPPMSPSITRNLQVSCSIGNPLWKNSIIQTGTWIAHTKKSITLTNLSKLYLCSLLLLQACDTETNPGPSFNKSNKTIDPCGTCSAHVSWTEKAVCCESCNQWFHTNCQGISSLSYDRLHSPSVVWICQTCGTPNYSVTLFDISSLETPNSFSNLINNPASVATSPGAPQATSSPIIPKKPTKNKPTKIVKPLRIININFHSIGNKAAEIQNLLDSVKPDIIIGTETWLTHDQITGQCFDPDYFEVFRKDRADGYGGVLIAVTRDYLFEEVPELESDGELLWIKSTMVGMPTLYVGAFYRPNQQSSHLEALDGTLQKISHLPNKNIILAGDFNLGHIDWDTPCHITGKPQKLEHDKLLDILFDNSLENIAKFKVGTHESGNTLDLILVNNPNSVNRTELLPAMSDHYPVFAELSLSAHKIQEKPRTIPLYRKADWDALREDLVNFKFQMDPTMTDNVDELWSTFSNHLNKSIQKYIPLKTITKQMKFPWIDDSIRKLIKKRNNLHHKAKQTGKENIKARSKQVKHQVQKQIRKSFWNYIDGLVSFDDDDDFKFQRPPKQKRLFQYVKSLRKDSSGIASLKSNGSLITDPIEKADLLNKQYESVFTKEPDGSLPDLGPSPHPQMNTPFITTPGISKLLSQLKPDKAPGPDNITARVLKELHKEIAPILTTIFQISLTQGKLPKQWKEANVIPIFKKGSKYLPSNYRPVSLTCIICKVLEHILVSSIMTHFENHNILHPNQHGFRKKLSCETQLIELTNDLAKSLDNRTQTDLLIMDFSKAFDKVPHKRLISKLSWLGITGPTLSWISDFLHDRTQRVLLEGETSTPRPVTSGVPQGTVLGPILFLAYINDLPSSIKHSNIRLFADDCVLYKQILSPSDSDLLQQDLSAVQDWETTWLMEFNVDKCFTMRCTHSKKPIPNDYWLHSKPLQLVEDTKYLGVTLANDLTWRKHISKTVGQASKTLNFLNRTLKITSTKTKAQAYKALVRPKLEYASSVWDPHHKVWIDALERVQNRAARFATNRWHNTSSVTNMKEHLGWEPLQARRKVTRLIMFYKINFNLVYIHLPTYFQLSSNTLRTHHSFHYMIPAVNKDCLKFSFYHRTIRDWNSLPSGLFTVDFPVPLDTFKSRLVRVI